MSEPTITRADFQYRKPVTERAERIKNMAMRRLEILSDDAVVTEMWLDKQEFSIGRDPDGDVLLADPKISRNHAKLKRIYSNYYIEDQQSTNGTLLNGKPVQKQIFRPGDSLQIGNFELRYAAEKKDDFDVTAVRAIVQQFSDSKQDGMIKASVVFLRGPNAGQAKILTKSLFTIGEFGENVGVIARRAHGVFLMHLGAQVLPSINGVKMDRSTMKLHDGDVIDVGAHQLRVDFA